ncbi:hypothetical protein ACQ5SO_14025 [Rhodovulum sp. DZ06]|uniref:hypothetical protein n=1 Tax=Rhodovulum sp. DZ06 TaxID=3425126 RepID=UPI003D331D59
MTASDSPPPRARPGASGDAPDPAAAAPSPGGRAAPPGTGAARAPADAGAPAQSAAPPRGGRLHRLSERLFDAFSSGRRGLAATAFASFLEGTVVPLPVESVTAPMMVSRPKRAWRVAAAMMLGSLLAAAAMYALAWGIADAAPALARAAGVAGEAGAALEALRARLTDEGVFWAVFLASVSFAPMQLAALAAGAAGGNFAVFMAAIAASRAIRAFGLAALCIAFGAQAERIMGSRALLALGLLLTLGAIWAARLALGG